jgi:hypothetical protein
VSIPTLWLLFASMGVALMLGGGIYESVVICPQWRANPPASFRIIQQSTGVPLQRFWIPVHVAITVLMIGAVTSNWGYSQRRDLLLIGAGSYIVMRLWSAVYFIPEMLCFQKVPLESAATPELLSRVKRWTTLTWLREPLDIITQVCLLVALSRSVM